MNQNLKKSGMLISALLLSIQASSCSQKAEAGPEPKDRVPSTLHVPLIGQIGDYWCWAACTEMVTTYYHNTIDSTAPIIKQCNLVKLLYKDTCCLDCKTVQPGNVPAEFDQNGAPFPQTDPNSANCEGYTYSVTQGPDTHLSWAVVMLSEDSLRAQIRNRMPVIFEWFWTADVLDSATQQDAHIMVAEGIPHSSYIYSHMWIAINDPLPTGRGRHRIISYAEYANIKPMTIPGSPLQYTYSTHGMDYYAFHYQKPAQQ
ncbi:MAG: papain-like cysteine protease family protein [Bacteroidota bacterium]|nr:papain-like cysteine protease family protein [Bacteroidota bacterium]MDP4230583.1 papain-like cysteine protease family protein [Bacteroidota bacterium]MDP4237649.1 papain-like cysteine protease family protein [Bacteroidota bacterium]